MKNIIDQSPKPETNHAQRPGDTVASQLELTLTSTPACPLRRPARRNERASWWFTQMRQCVDRAATSASQPVSTDLQPQSALV
jgi:hypothetical protein